MSKPKSLILNMPHLVSPLTKIVSGLVTIVFWAFFSYLWIPLLVLIAGAFGFQMESKMQYAQGALSFKQLTISYSVVIVVLGGSLLLWALLEYMRFRNSSRRREPLPVEVADLTSHTKMNASDLAIWQASRRIIAHHHADGRISEFEHAANETILLRRA